MSATDPTEVQSARRPKSYASVPDTGPCEGRQASPSNPTGAGNARTKEPLTETFVFRCTAAEKALLRAKADAARLRAATLLREALVLAVGRIGGNLNQITRWLNCVMLTGRTDLGAAAKWYRLPITHVQKMGKEFWNDRRETR